MVAGTICGFLRAYNRLIELVPEVRSRGLGTAAGAPGT